MMQNFVLKIKWYGQLFANAIRYVLFGEIRTAISRQKIPAFFLYIVVGWLLWVLPCCSELPKEKQWPAGLELVKSLEVTEDTIILSTDTKEAGLVVKKDGIVLDFGNAVVLGGEVGRRPEELSGTAIQIDNRSNVTIRNAHFQGFAEGISISNSSNIRIEHCTFSYLHRVRGGEEQNTDNGSAVIAEQVNDLWLKSVQVCNSRNGLTASACSGIRIDSSRFTFLSGNAVSLKAVQDFTLERSVIAYLPKKNNGFAVMAEGKTNGVVRGNTFFQLADITNNGDLNVVDNNTAYLANQEEAEDTLSSRIAEELGILRPDLYLLNDWGPYDFQYPVCWFRKQTGKEYTFLLTGPTGNWRLTGGKGFLHVNPKTGTFPVTVQAIAEPTADSLEIQLEFIGEAIRMPQGELKRRGTVIPFGFSQAVITKPSNNEGTN